MGNITYRQHLERERLLRLEWHLRTLALQSEVFPDQVRFGGLTLSEITARLQSLDAGRSMPPEFIGDLT